MNEFSLERVLVTAGRGEEAQAASLIAASAMPNRYVNRAGRLSFVALAVLIGQVRLLLTNDSGPSHMAVALGTPFVIVYGSGPPLNWAPLLRAWHRPVADWEAPCRLGLDDGCADTGDVRCLRNMSVKAVLDAARQVMELGQPAWTGG